MKKIIMIAFGIFAGQLMAQTEKKLPSPPPAPPAVKMVKFPPPPPPPPMPPKKEVNKSSSRPSHTKMQKEKLHFVPPKVVKNSKK